VRGGAGRHLLSESDKTRQSAAHRDRHRQALLGFVAERLLVDAAYVEVLINGTLVHRSRPDTWRTRPTDECSTQ